MAGAFGDKPLVVVGDLNSDPYDGPLVACIIQGTCPTPYSVMVANGYTDAWTVRKGRFDPGYTCCQEDLLMNVGSLLDERIDHVWLRPPMTAAAGATFLKSVRAKTLGDRRRDKSVDRLWPSDHAGGALRFQILARQPLAANGRIGRAQ